MGKKDKDKKIGDTLSFEDREDVLAGEDPSETLPFTFETLSDVASEIGMIRHGYAVNIDRSAAAPDAEEHFRACLALLEQARCQAKLATYAQVRAVTNARTGG